FRSGLDWFREGAVPEMAGFNQVGKVKRLLVVLLVGENAVSGVHKVAMGRALTLIRHHVDWEVARRQKPDEPFLILGPFFSGTQSSLSQVIADWSAAMLSTTGDAPYSFYLLSGSATAVDPKKFLKALSQPGQEAVKEIRFFATMIPEDIILRSL